MKFNIIKKNVIYIILFTIIQGCSSAYVSHDPLFDRPSSEVYELMFPTNIHVYESTGGVFLKNPHKGRFLPGSYNLSLVFIIEQSNRIYRSNPLITVHAIPGRVSRLDYSMLSNTLEVKIIDITFWEKLKSFHDIKKSKLTINDDIYKFPELFNDIGYENAYYHILNTHSDVYYKNKSIKYMELGVNFAHAPSMYTFSVYKILFNSQINPINRTKINEGYKLYKEALDNGYYLAKANHLKILDVINEANK